MHLTRDFHIITEVREETERLLERLQAHEDDDGSAEAAPVDRRELFAQAGLDGACCVLHAVSYVSSLPRMVAERVCMCSLPVLIHR